MDSHFLAGEFLDDSGIPRDKRYLYRYFRTKTQRQFVRYALLFDRNTFFEEHTGIPCPQSSREAMEIKLRDVMEAHRVAKANIDLDGLEHIEKGRYQHKRYGGKQRPG